MEANERRSIMTGFKSDDTNCYTFTQILSYH